MARSNNVILYVFQYMWDDKIWYQDDIYQYQYNGIRYGIHFNTCPVVVLDKMPCLRLLKFQYLVDELLQWSLMQCTFFIASLLGRPTG